MNLSSHRYFKLIALFVCAVVCLDALPAHAKRLALIIGNDNYLHVSKLQKAGNDAQAMATELREAGFEVTLHRDLNYRSMVHATEALYSTIEGGDEVVVFFAGHGVQIKSGNYLLPTDIEATSESAVEKTSYALNDLSEKLEAAKAAFSLIMVDACRDNPLKTRGRSIGNSRGLSPPDPPIGQMVVYSASRGEQALDRLGDDDPDPNSVFTREFIRRMRSPGRRVEDLVREIQISVEKLAATVGHKQRPALYNEVRGNFYFYGPTTIVLPPKPAGTPSGMDEFNREDRFWEDTKAAGNRDGFAAYLEQYPSGRYASLARANINRLTGGAADGATNQNKPASGTSPTPAATQAAQQPAVSTDKSPTAAPSPQKPLATAIAVLSAAFKQPAAEKSPQPNSATAVADPLTSKGKSSTRVTLPNGDQYEGDVIGLVPNGVGKYTFVNADRYEGDFVNNYFDGKGTHTLASGDVYTGEFRRSVKTGYGSYRFANGNLYEGNFLDNEFHGHGTQTFKFGDSYEGEFVHGVKQGKGIYRFANGDRFEGSFVDNLFSGKGVIVFASGDRYEGDVLKGVKHGQGVHFFVSKDRYEGGFVDGAQSGQGTHFYANGDRYEGGFAAGVRHGKGVYRFANGLLKEQEFVNGVEK